MKQLIENWPTYFFEILVLIIGIYEAFAVDNWNENRKERNFEENILKQVKIGLVKDVNRISHNRRQHQKLVMSQPKILK